MISNLRRNVWKCAKLCNFRYCNVEKSFSTKTLVIADYSDNSDSTQKIVTAARLLGNDITLVGYDEQNMNNVDGVTKHIIIENYLPSSINIEQLAKFYSKLSKGYTHVIAPCNNQWKNILPRVAALNDSSCLTEVISIVSHEAFKRPIYAGNAISTVKLPDPIKVKFPTTMLKK